MDINAELELVKDFDNSSKFINEPGVFIVKIKSYLLSESRKDYKGNPYIEFAVETEDQKTSNVTFYLLTGKESEKAREFKLKRLKGTPYLLLYDLGEILTFEIFFNIIVKSIKF